MRALVLNPERAHVRHRAPTRPEPARHGLQDRIGNSGVLSALQRSRPSAISRGSQPLDSNVRRHLESSFGHDFGGVRLRADADADRAARGRGALAYTHGNEITVRPRALAGAEGGFGVLAHEIAHVVQQGAAPFLHGGPRSSGGPAHVGCADHEHEADAAATIAASGGTVAGLTRTTSSVQFTNGPSSGPGSDLTALANEIQIWIDSLSADYAGTPVSGTYMHDAMNRALVDIADPRLMTEVTLDPAGYVLDMAEGPASVASARSAMEMAVEESGGYFRSVDAVLITAEDPAVIEAIRRGSLPVTGRAIPIDHKFGGAVVNKAGEAAIREMFGTETIACKPGGDLAGEVGWVSMEMQMSGEPLPPLSLSTALDVVPATAAGAVEPIGGAAGDAAAVEAAGAKGVRTGAAPRGAGRGATLRGAAGAAGTVVGVLGVVSMAKQLHDTGCIGMFAEAKAEGGFEARPLCLGGEPREILGTAQESVRVLPIVPVLEPEDAEKTLREGEYFVKPGPFFFDDALWQIVGGSAQATGYEWDHDDVYTKKWTYVVYSDQA